MERQRKYDGFDKGKGTYIEHIIRDSLVGERLLGDQLPSNPLAIIDQAGALQERYIQRLGPRGADPAYRDSLPVWEVAKAYFAAALKTRDFRDVAKQVYDKGRRQVLDNGFNASTRDPSAKALYPTFAQDNALADAYITVADELVGKLVKQFLTNKELAKAWDHYTLNNQSPNPDGLSLEDIENFDAKKYLAEHPEIGVPQEVQDAIKPDGTMEISLADLEKLVKEEFATINASIDDMQQTLLDITKRQGELADYMKNVDQRLKDQEQTAAKEKEHQLKMQAASSAVSIVSTLVSLEDPELGKQIATVGQSALQIYASIKKLTQAAAAVEGIGAVATAAATGNIIGAVLNVALLFEPQQPTPEQLILGEIGKLREQVSELRSEMHTRFDRIDAQFNTIYTTMHDRFNQIDLKLGKITTSLDEVQQSLLTLRQVNGRKRHLLVDTQGFVLLVKVHAANIADRDGASLVLATLPTRFPLIRKIWTDSIYNGSFHSWAAEYLPKCDVEIKLKKWNSAS